MWSRGKNGTVKIKPVRSLGQGWDMKCLRVNIFAVPLFCLDVLSREHYCTVGVSDIDTSPCS